LQAFVAVADHLNFRAAAEDLHLSATALSRRINQLESTLDSRFFERNTRRVELTPAGRAFLSHARTALEQLTGAVTGLRDFTAQQNGRLTIGCIPSAAHYFLPGILREYTARNPRMLVRIIDESATTILNSVISGESDFGLNFIGAQEPGIQFRSILHEAYVLIVHKDHRLASRTKVAWSEVADERFVNVAKTSGNRLLLDTALANVPRLPVTRLETARVSTLLGLVEAGLGVAAVPRLAAPPDSRSAVVGIPLIKPVVHRHVGLIRRTQRPLRPAAQELYDMIYQAGRKMAAARSR